LARFSRSRDRRMDLRHPQNPRFKLAPSGTPSAVHLPA